MSLSWFLDHAGIEVTSSYYTRYDTVALKREHAEHSTRRGLVGSYNLESKTALA